MTHKQKNHTYEKAYKFLDGLSVYEIRSICRALNIPAGLNKKQRLISDIIKAVSERGIPESAVLRDKPRETSDYILNKLRQIREECAGEEGFRYGNAEIAVADQICTVKAGMAQAVLTAVTDAEAFRTLAELVYLGNVVINGNRKTGQTVEKYEKTADKIYRQYYILENSVSDAGAIEENEIGDVRDRLYDRVKRYLDDFERDAYIGKLSELFAERMYPTGNVYDEERLLRGRAAELLCGRELVRQGDNIVRIDIEGATEKVESMLREDRAER